MASPTAASQRNPLGVAALSNPGYLQLAKSSSMPNMHMQPRMGNNSPAHRSDGFANQAMMMASSRGTSLSPKARVDPWSPKGKADQYAISPKARGNGNSSQLAMSATFSLGSWGNGPPRSSATDTKLPRGLMAKQHVFQPRNFPETKLRRFYERGDLPINIRHGATPGVEWKVEPEKLDYRHHLPIFFDGLMEKVYPYDALAYEGLRDLLNAGRGKNIIHPVVPLIMVPLRRCLETNDNVIMCKAINMLQLLCQCDENVGPMLVPYYRQILPTFNRYKDRNLNLGDGIEYSQRKRENMADLCTETLEMLEKTGGDDAFINIKYMIPTYESCMMG